MAEQAHIVKICSRGQGGIVIEIFVLLVPFINEYWYITIPEVLYLLFVTGRFMGMYAVIPFMIFSFLLLSYPIPTMEAVGGIMAVHAVYLLFRKIAGDKLAKEKTDTVKPGYGGVPSMAPIKRTEGSTGSPDGSAVSPVGYDNCYENENSTGPFDPYTCPYCGSSNTDGNHCYDCGEDF